MVVGEAKSWGNHTTLAVRQKKMHPRSTQECGQRKHATSDQHSLLLSFLLHTLTRVCLRRVLRAPTARPRVLSASTRGPRERFTHSGESVRWLSGFGENRPSQYVYKLAPLSSRW